MSMDKYEEIANIEWRYESWEFDQTAIYVRKTDGAVFHASDSGCSCPMPFEDTTESDLEPIRSMEDFTALVKAEGHTHPTQTREDIAAAKTAVREALKAWNK